MILGSGNFQKTGKNYLMQVAQHGAAGAFIPLAHVKLLLKSLFRENKYFFYWQLLIILFAVDRAKKIWNYNSLCIEKGKIYFWRDRFWRGSPIDKTRTNGPIEKLVKNKVLLIRFFRSFY